MFTRPMFTLALGAIATAVVCCGNPSFKGAKSSQNPAEVATATPTSAAEPPVPTAVPSDPKATPVATATLLATPMPTPTLSPLDLESQCLLHHADTYNVALILDTSLSTNITDPDNVRQSGG